MTDSYRANGRGVFHTRDSGGKHEQTPAEYVGWAARKSLELGIKFSGTANEINEMIRSGKPVLGDLYFDYCVAGNELSRPALDALRADIKKDSSISHVLIPRRDRLARPDDPADAIRIENELRWQGVTIVMMDRLLPPLKKGRRVDLGEAITAYIEYDQSGRFLEQLAEKMIYAQLSLAKQGYSTGGRAPFGFRRTLVRDDGTLVRQLNDGEIVRQAGHHVIWLPGPDHEIELIRRILRMLETTPASQVAKQLSDEGIPSPNKGRFRMDNGIRHQVSGRWHQPTITGIARNKLLVAVTSYGQRSLGKTLRMSPEGPRELGESDLRDDGKPKVTRNPDKEMIRSIGRFDPLVPLEQHERLVKVLDDRGGTQRGKPRSRDPEKNPLGGRVTDLDCSWPMYRIPKGDSFHYTCGLYQQSHSQKCEHNQVDGILATRFVLAGVQQRLLKPGLMDRLEDKLRKRAKSDAAQSQHDQELARKTAELAELRANIKLISTNLALTATPAQYQAVSGVFDDLQEREPRLAKEVKQLEQAGQSNGTDEVLAALSIAHQLTSLASDASNLGALGRLFATLDVQLFLRFLPVQKKKRKEQKLSGGVLTFGAAVQPIQKYAGPTGRRALMGGVPPINANSVISDEEKKSSGNVSRGDRS